MEEWKTLENDKYSISSFGRVWNNVTGVFLKPAKAGTKTLKNGTNIFYLMVWVGKRREYVHRLVAMSFIPNVMNHPQVNHKDGDRTNNCVGNLEWVTCRENHLHSYRNGRKPVEGNFQDQTGSRHPRAKLNEDKVYDIKNSYFKKGITQRELSLKYDVSFQLISNICCGKVWKHIKLNDVDL